MLKPPVLKLSFNIQTTNEQRYEAFELYRQAFGAKKLSESVPPGGTDIHIMMEIGGVEMLFGPGSAAAKGLGNAFILEAHFDDEAEFRRAFDLLAKEGQDASLEGPYPWATLLGLVTDKFGVGWALYYQ